MSKIVNDLNSKDFYKYCKLFGFGTKTGISLKDESSGNIRNLNNWSKTSKTYLSIGQELSVTNLQLAMAYAAIANGGYLLKPNIIKMISSGENEIMYTKDIYPIRKVLKKENSEELLRYLKNVVKNGTAENLNLNGIDFVKVLHNSGSQISDFENEELITELMDWQRALSSGIMSTKAREIISKEYTETNSERNKNLINKISKELKIGSNAILFMREDHGLQFDSDTEVFYVSSNTINKGHDWLKIEIDKLMNSTKSEN